MKILSIISIFFAVFVFIVSGCDSVTGDRPLQVTTPSLVAPVNNDSLNVPITPTFKWSGGAEKLEIATSLYLNNIIFSTAVTDSSYTIASGVLNHNTWYYWHAGKTTGGIMYWSGVFSFKTN